jgi:hypothetical protein
MIKYCFLISFAVFFLSCTYEYSENEIPLDDKFECVLQNSNPDILKSKDEVLQHIYGTWKVVKILAWLKTNDMKNMKLEFKDVLGAPIDKQIVELYIDDKSVGSLTYSIKEQKVGDELYLLFETENTKFGDSDEYNFIYGSSLKMCPEEMLIDNGMDLDGPGYLLKKIK